MLKTILITFSIGMVVGFGGTLLSLFGGGSVQVEYLEFAVALLLFLVMLVGAYWFVVGGAGTSERASREDKPVA
jgi:cation transporter-like permease